MSTLLSADLARWLVTFKSNADELALIAQEMGAKVIRGPVHYSSEAGDIEVGGVDIGEYPYELRGQQVMRIVAPLGPVEELPVICGLCGTPYEGDECPTCRQEREDAKRLIGGESSEDRHEKGLLIGDTEMWLVERR
jgi:hypothetical protein